MRKADLHFVRALGFAAGALVVSLGGTAHAVDTNHWQSVLDNIGSAQAREGYLDRRLSSVRVDANTQNNVDRAFRFRQGLSRSLSRTNYQRATRPIRDEPLRFKPRAKVGGLANRISDTAHPFTFGAIRPPEGQGAGSTFSLGGIREGGTPFEFGARP